MIIIQCAILMVFLAIGESLAWIFDIPIPGSIIGMLLLTAALRAKVIKLRYVSGVADFLVKNLGFFFVPAGVALMNYFQLIREQWIPIVVASSISTILVLAVTGQLHQLIRKYFSRHAVFRK